MQTMSMSKRNKSISSIETTNKMKSHIMLHLSCSTIVCVVRSDMSITFQSVYNFSCWQLFVKPQASIALQESTTTTNPRMFQHRNRILCKLSGKKSVICLNGELWSFGISIYTRMYRNTLSNKVHSNVRNTQTTIYNPCWRECTDSVSENIRRKL